MIKFDYSIRVSDDMLNNVRQMTINLGTPEEKVDNVLIANGLALLIKVMCLGGQGDVQVLDIEMIDND